MAWAAAEAVSKDPGKAYNPLFFWGGVGVGKTHLMNAVGYEIIKKEPDANVIFCTGEGFTNDIVEGIRNKTTQGFRKKYRKLKALLIDDIQFIAGKDAVQEEFFHTFNSLVGGGAQIILTSDRPPNEISKLEERLRSRFEAGLIVDISQPDFELRCAIVQIKAKERGLDIPMDAVQLIAGNLETARKIEGFLIRVSSIAKVKNSDIDTELVENILGKADETNGQTQIKANPNDFISAVSKYYSIGKRKLLGSSRARPIARPRQVLMYLLRTQLGLPLQEVGRLVGDRDHTTVMHAVDKITNLASDNVNIRQDIRGIKNMI
jgi:chromosomal replication initiator protein